MNDLPTPSANALAASQALVAEIAHTIRTQGGWISFADYMQRALYTPQLGYYSGGSHKIGTGGDFVTAPSLTPLFGQTLAQQLRPLLAQTAGNVYEFGAGTGSLASSIVNALAEDEWAHYYIIDVSPDLIERQQKWFATHCPANIQHKISHLDRLPEHLDGIVIGNEVLDAMPCEVVIWQTDGSIAQQGVTLDEHKQLQLSARPLTQPTLLAEAQRLRPPTTPYTSELHLAQQGFIHTLAERLQRGAIIMLDYGFDAAQYYHPQRHMGTLIGHYRHHTVHDPFFYPGLTDLTCHVNFTAMAEAGTAAGLDLIGYTTQAHFLLNLGLTEQLAAVGASDSVAYLQAAAACQKLLAPHEMGELFKIIAFGRGVTVDWAGFAQGDICHKL